jgi:large subunit ribosomal protein L5
MARLMERYQKEVVTKLTTELGYTNRLALPRLEKVVVSMGLGAATKNKALMEQAQKDLTLITAQKPQVMKARKSVAGFMLRKGQEVGLKVTLRGRRMYEFLDRLISTAIPRIRDFRGLNPKSFDHAGNYSLGISEQAVFPEISVEQIQASQGMNVTIGIRSRKKEDSVALLQAMGFPFRS